MLTVFNIHRHKRHCMVTAVAELFSGEAGEAARRGYRKSSDAGKLARGAGLYGPILNELWFMYTLEYVRTHHHGA
jgi:hypothetical protein